MADLARQRWGYGSKEVAKILGYASTAGVSEAIRRVKEGGSQVHNRLRAIERECTID